MANTLYIATGSAPLSSQFQEMLDMLLTGAAFGQATTLWLSDACLDQLALHPNETLAQLGDFGVRCVTTTTAPAASFPVEILSADALLSLRRHSDQVMVF